MSLLKKRSISILSRISGNKFVQKLLQKNVYISQYFMGIGSGSSVSTSGERIIFNVLSMRCEPPYCIFDVGAYKGHFLDLALETISVTDFSIHCFEPGGETFKSLIERKKDSRVKFNNIGIGKEKGYMSLFYNTAGSALASLTKRKLDHLGIEFDKSETVQIETIDNYCKENKIKRINLLKTDIEGHELDAFEGAKEMFANNAIDIVTFEFGGCNIDTRTFFQDFWYFFLDVNMKLFRITPSGYLSQIESYKEIDEQFSTTNFIAIKNG
jgi:FkbM family methyltransferase